MDMMENNNEEIHVIIDVSDDSLPDTEPEYQEEVLADRSDEEEDELEFPEFARGIKRKVNADSDHETTEEQSEAVETDNYETQNFNESTRHSHESSEDSLDNSTEELAKSSEGSSRKKRKLKDKGQLDKGDLVKKMLDVDIVIAALRGIATCVVPIAEELEKI